jgi:hypothetical protein
MRSRDENFTGGSLVAVGSVVFLTTGPPPAAFHQSSMVLLGFYKSRLRIPGLYGERGQDMTVPTGLDGHDVRRTHNTTAASWSRGGGLDHHSVRVGTPVPSRRRRDPHERLAKPYA